MADTDCASTDCQDHTKDIIVVLGVAIIACGKLKCHVTKPSYLSSESPLPSQQMLCMIHTLDLTSSEKIPALSLRIFFPSQKFSGFS